MVLPENCKNDFLGNTFGRKDVECRTLDSLNVEEMSKSDFLGNHFESENVDCRTHASLKAQEKQDFDFPGNHLCKKIAKPFPRSWGKTLVDLEDSQRAKAVCRKCSAGPCAGQALVFCHGKRGVL